MFTDSIDMHQQLLYIFLAFRSKCVGLKSINSVDSVIDHNLVGSKAKVEQVITLETFRNRADSRSRNDLKYKS